MARESVGLTRNSSRPPASSCTATGCSPLESCPHPSSKSLPPRAHVPLGALDRRRGVSRLLQRPRKQRRAYCRTADRRRLRPAGPRSEAHNRRADARQGKGQVGRWREGRVCARGGLDRERRACRWREYVAVLSLNNTLPEMRAAYPVKQDADVHAVEPSALLNAQSRCLSQPTSLSNTSSSGHTMLPLLHPTQRHLRIDSAYRNRGFCAPPHRHWRRRRPTTGGLSSRP